jgi:hypothetical protein
LRPQKWNAEYSFELINHTKYSIPTSSGSSSSSSRIKYSQSVTNINAQKAMISNQKNLAVNSIKNSVTIDNDFSKIAKKLDYDYVPPSHTNKTLNKKNNNYEMKLIKMQHMQHNVDLVNFTYINKVKNIKNYKVLFFFIYLLLNTTLN